MHLNPWAYLLVVDPPVVVLVHLIHHLPRKLDGGAAGHDLDQVLGRDETVAIMVQLLKRLADLGTAQSRDADARSGRR